MNNKYEMNMCSGNLLKKIIIYALPLMFTGILQLLYNAADIIVVGRYAGDESLAAVGSTSSLINLIVNVFMGLSVGSCVVLAKEYGAKDLQGSSKVVSTSIKLSIICGLFVSLFGVCFSKQMLILMDTPEDVLYLASAYLTIYFIGAPFNMIYNFGSSLLRAVGDTKRPLYILFFSGLINVLLNLLFVITFKIGVVGVALATIISQTISAVLIIICLIKNDSYCHLDIKKMKVDFVTLKEIAKIGVPSGIQSSIFSISNVLIQSSINSFGSDAIAGNSAATNIEGFTYTSMNTLYQAAVAFTGQNVGSKKIKNVKRILLDCILCVTVVGITMGYLSNVFSYQLLSIYTDGVNVIEFGALRLKIICLTYFLCGIMDVLVGSLRGLGHSTMPMIVSIIGVCGFRILWVFTIFKKTNDLTVLYYSYPISWIITASIHLICYLFIFHKMICKSKKRIYA